MLKQHVLYIHNIPLNYHARHLRNFFSQYVESGKLDCFHFRHRPELVFPPAKELTCASIRSAVCARRRNKLKQCAFIRFSDVDELARFVYHYDQMHWLCPNTDEYPLAESCQFVKVEMDGDLSDLIEFTPPSWMPQGNVGTPTSFFFNQIKSCQLDSSVITKLGLNFPRCSRQRPYGSVPYVYDADLISTERSSAWAWIVEPRSCTGVRLMDDNDYTDFVESRIATSELQPSPNRNQFPSPPAGEQEEVEDESCEEWDRFESLHDDPYKVERRDKANLKYEDKIELVWEKGGSGLVFHTDERTWRKLDPLRKEEIFDEPASFDWDIDMDIYESAEQVADGPTPMGHWGAARDSAELVNIQRTNEDLDITTHSLTSKELLCRETCKKGFGFRQLTRMGWKPGVGLGRTSTNGIINPLTIEGHLPPTVRTGFGYHRQSQRHLKQPVCYQPLPTTYIRTVFDKPDYVSSRSGLGLSASLLRRIDAHHIVKYRSHSPEVRSKPVLPPSSTGPMNRTIILNSNAPLSKEGVTFVSGGLLHPNR